MPKNLSSALQGQQLPSVRATIGYSENIGRARKDLVETDRTFMPLEFRKIEIRDARPVRDLLDVEREGFVLLDHETRVTDFQDPARFSDTYHDELIDLVRQKSDADFFVAARSYMGLRNPPTGDVVMDGLTAPAIFAHTDFTQGSFYKHMQLALTIEGVSDRDFSRVALYQIWRPLSAPPEDYPLALMDATSVDNEEFVIMDNIIGPTLPGNSLQPKLPLFSPNHRWYYFSDMTPNEVILFKGNDSARGDTLTVFHTAFDNRANTIEAKPRYSVEARIFAFWN